MRTSDYARYYLAFSPTELALPPDEFEALLDARLAEAHRWLLAEYADA